jgi:hypothetical protein
MRDAASGSGIGFSFTAFKPRILFQEEVGRLIAQESIVILKISQIETLSRRYALHMRNIIGGVLRGKISMTGINDAFKRRKGKGDEVRALSVAGQERDLAQCHSAVSVEGDQLMVAQNVKYVFNGAAGNCLSHQSPEANPTALERE